MIGFTVFDVVNGFQCQHYFRLAQDGMGQRFPISFLEGRVKLRNDELILSRSMSPVYLISRCDTEHGALTWVGRYSPMPTDYADRDGSYFGVGIWFLESILLAEALTALIETIDRALRELMRNSNRSAWDIKTLRASQLGINPKYTDEITTKEQPAIGVGISGKEQQRLGFCVANGLSQPSGDVNDLNLAIDHICFGPPISYVSKVIIAQDPEAAAALRRSAYAIEIKVERILNSGAASVSEAKAANVVRPGPPGASKGSAEIAVSVAALQPRVDQIEATVLKTGRAIRFSRWFSIIALLFSIAAAFLSAQALLTQTEARPPAIAPAKTSSPNLMNPTPTPSTRADSGRGEPQQTTAQAGFDGHDKTGTSTGATRPVEPRYDFELVGLVSEIDSLLRRKELSGTSVLKANLEKARDEAQKQIEFLKAVQPGSPQLK